MALSMLVPVFVPTSRSFKRSGTIFTDHPSNAKDEFMLVLLGLSFLGEQRQLQSSFDGLGTDARELAAQEELLEIKNGTHPAELTLERIHMDRIKEPVEIAHLRVGFEQLELLAVEGEWNEY